MLPEIEGNEKNPHYSQAMKVILFLRKLRIFWLFCWLVIAVLSVVIMQTKIISSAVGALVCIPLFLFVFGVTWIITGFKTLEIIRKYGSEFKIFAYPGAELAAFTLGRLLTKDDLHRGAWVDILGGFAIILLGIFFPILMFILGLIK
jgi:hypothetical protein